MRCCRAQGSHGFARQRPQSSVDEVVQRLGDRQRLSAIDGDAAAAQGTDDLEGVERVAPDAFRTSSRTGLGEPVPDVTARRDAERRRRVGPRRRF